MGIRSGLALLLLAAAPTPALAAARLPDLDQEQPRNLEVTVDHTGAVPRFHLGFDSSVDNVGKGPLIIDARRASSSSPQMIADQTIRGGAEVRRVGQLQYVYSEDHDHWHYLGFDRYQLRRASDNRFVAPDQKTGFCLGDRYATHPDHTRLDPGFTDECGRGETGLLTLREGITPGYGDVYYATLEGQFVDITGVPAGRYYVVHRVNANRKLRESDYSNNAASVLIRLGWPKGMQAKPSIRVLRRCADSGVCPSAAAVSEAGQRLMAFHDPFLDGIRLWAIMHQVPRLVRNPLGSLWGGVPAQ